MKVMVVWKGLVVGAYQQKLQELARQKDVEVVGVAPPSWDEPGSPVQFEGLYLDGYQMVVSRIAFNGHFHVFFFPDLGRLLDEHKPDLLHVEEEPYNLASFLAIREARHRAIPSVFFTWQNLDRRYPPPFSWMERYVYRWASAAIAGTDAAARVLRAKGYHGSPAVIPQIGIDPELLHPVERDGTGLERPLNIGFVGRLVPQKGVRLLIEACASLGAPFRLAIVGGGPSRPELELQARLAGIASKTEFAGSVPSAQVPEMLTQLDVLVLPSISLPNWTEQFGRALVEAMACGVTVIGSTCGEIPDVIGDAGLIFPEGDANALRSQLERVATDRLLRQDLARRGRERVLARFTNQRIATETAAVYRAVVER